MPSERDKASENPYDAPSSEHCPSFATTMLPGLWFAIFAVAFVGSATCPYILLGVCTLLSQIGSDWGRFAMEILAILSPYICLIVSCVLLAWPFFSSRIRRRPVRKRATWITSFYAGLAVGSGVIGTLIILGVVYDGIVR